MNEHSDHRSFNWSLKINSGLTGIRPLAFGTTRRIGRQLYCTFFTLLWHFEKLLWRWEVNTASSREIVIFRPFFTFASSGGNCTSYYTYHAVGDLMQKHSKYLLQGKSKSAGETKKSKEMHRLKSVRGGGETPIWKGGDAHHLALRYKFQISVSLRSFWAKRHYI